MQLINCELHIPKGMAHKSTKHDFGAPVEGDCADPSSSKSSTVIEKLDIHVFHAGNKNLESLS